MLWHLIKKELLLNLMTFRFWMGAVLCIGLVGGLMPVLVQEHRQRLTKYHETVQASEDILHDVKVYKHILAGGMLHAALPPEVLSVFNQGVSRQIADSYRIDFTSVPRLSGRSVYVNPYLAVLPALDVSLVMRIVLSLLALLVSYNAICGEREKGTLKLVLAGQTGRMGVLFSKYLAGLVTLAIPLLLSFIVGLLVLDGTPEVELTRSEWIRLGWIGIGSLVFVSTLISLGLAFSCVASHSATSLILCLLLWTLFVVVIPNTGIHLATWLSPLPPYEEIDSQVNQVREQRDKEINAVYKQHPRSGPVEEQGVGYHVYVMVGPPAAIDAQTQRNAKTRSLFLSYSRKIGQIKQQYEQRLERQQNLAHNLGRLSPVFVFDRILSVLCGTDVHALQAGAAQLRAFRDEVFAYLRQKTDNFSSPAWFTRCTAEDQRFYQSYRDKEVTEEAFKTWKAKRVSQISALNLADFPRFQYSPSLATLLKGALPDFGILILINVLCMAGAFVALQRYDVR